MVLVKNKGFSKYVDTTLGKINRLCEQYKSCGRYLHGNNASIVKTKNKTSISFRHLHVNNASIVKKKIKTSIGLGLGPMTWKNCQTYKGNRTNELFKQLKTITRVFTNTNTNYMLTYGTLLGIIRDNDINKNEVDNDIIVNKRFDPKTVKEELFKNGLIIFKHDIYRICNYSPVELLDTEPWGGRRYMVYSDVYPQLPNVLLHAANPNTIFRKKLKIVQRKIRDIYVNVPDENYANEFLTRLYGNWKIPSVTGWKKKIKNILK